MFVFYANTLKPLSSIAVTDSREVMVGMHKDLRQAAFPAASPSIPRIPLLRPGRAVKAAGGESPSPPVPALAGGSRVLAAD